MSHPRCWSLSSVLLVMLVASPGVAAEGQENASGHSYKLRFSGKQHVAIPKLRYDGSHPITLEAIVIGLYRGSILGDFERSGLGLDVANGYCAFHVNDGRATNHGYASIKSGTSIGHRKPIHIAGVLEGKKLRLYVAGKLQGSETIAKFKKSKHSFMIGADPTSNGRPQQFLHGVIGEVRVSKIARYANSFTPPTRFESDDHTLLLYRFNEGEGDIANDTSGNGRPGKIHGARWIK